MKGKAVVPGGTDPVSKALETEFGSERFARNVLERVICQCLGVGNDVLDRPAEYYIQRPDVMITVGEKLGVVMTLSGVSRDGRTPKCFHDALRILVAVSGATIRRALDDAKSDLAVQLFCVIQLDGQIETEPKTGKYTTQLESEAVWVGAGLEASW